MISSHDEIIRYQGSSPLYFTYFSHFISSLFYFLWLCHHNLLRQTKSSLKSTEMKKKRQKRWGGSWRVKCHERDTRSRKAKWLYRRRTNCIERSQHRSKSDMTWEKRNFIFLIFSSKKNEKTKMTGRQTVSKVYWNTVGCNIFSLFPGNSSRV